MTMKTAIRLTALVLVLSMLLPMGMAFASSDGHNSIYTYNYDFWDDYKETPDAYRVDQVIFSSTLGLETPMRRPQSLYILDEEIFVCDTGNNRVLQIHREGDLYTLVRIIDKITGASPETLSAPSDVFVDEDGNIYIADTNNNRVVKAD